MKSTPQPARPLEAWQSALIAEGQTYRISGYHTGDFTGFCVYVGKRLAQFKVIEPPSSQILNHEHCPFPGCVYPPDHSGEHNLEGLRIGSLVDVWLTGNAKIHPIEGVKKP